MVNKFKGYSIVSHVSGENIGRTQHNMYLRLIVARGGDTLQRNF